MIIGACGFLGMGDKNVAVRWDDLQARQDGNKLILLSSLTKDQLNSMPTYDYGRRQAQQRWARSACVDQDGCPYGARPRVADKTRSPASRDMGVTTRRHDPVVNVNGRYQCARS